jgi:hypothetical protein
MILHHSTHRLDWPPLASVPSGVLLRHSSLPTSS